MKKAFRVLALFVFVFCLSACGKMSDPTPLEGSGYPHTYPRR